MSGARTRRQAAMEAGGGDAKPAAQNGHDDGAAQRQDPGHSDDGDGDGDGDDLPDENIFLFLPNMIGYARVVLAFASLYYMPLHPRTCTLLYSVSCLLDALDGYAARYFEQSTRFGAVLDMVTDRCTTACLLVFLSSAFPRWAIVFQGLIVLDMASHYTHMYATLAMGGSGESHKNVDRSRSRILNLYYTNRTVLFIFCFLNEAFFIALYLLSFSSPLLSPNLLHKIPSDAAAEIMSGKQVDSSLLGQIFTNPYSAGALEMARANKMDSTVPWIVAIVSFPVMLGKQIINVVQFVKASKWLAEGDIKARKAQGLPRKKKI
ncbi:CDP-diacylglycerol-inositol 3-phosphatidyltransferase PIS [Gaeumannomyces tritici R3-111a-1]|uniref:CDP-diacylglycerol-inositol 3-phosphatidyltransferase PIS n=1 Tax=Gaeumannomyces tritici (strain R3-111a-1) TaxID=644352 RepID=J3P1D4_GAET3|nr:CDP-diacylglycerol-inositol 3-phosphatidyltransferase PIS [Gaeumannomyces tritici R3-111a-1]EJT77419.1 CDP-diacylglycerol-inositol 3-phosphatidyltransferase PIS [Gaeumannomyces tritici R3-111a-1]